MATVRGARNRTAGGGARCRYRLQERKERDDGKGKKSWGLEERSGVGWPGGEGGLRSRRGGRAVSAATAGLEFWRGRKPLGTFQSMGSFPGHLIGVGEWMVGKLQPLTVFVPVGAKERIGSVWDSAAFQNQTFARWPDPPGQDREMDQRKIFTDALRTYLLTWNGLIKSDARLLYGTVPSSGCIRRLRILGIWGKVNGERRGLTRRPLGI
ncbi:uncharacterized protein B0H64DRAFT_78417 [Chaetomium fimeti]|uniref:Uncharacterized protein n=1 Tax=Chaetomium fimeti TaxID=1854472 RepID=A0AAE0LV82_9PEZI|nr:hypothetical protein B0H64DRAFT_78417 [Chaetomium fimeti]